MKLENSAPLAGLFTAVASSLCCITPVVAFLAGTSSMASAFSWIEPARPYLLGVTVLALGFAWYQKLRPVPVDDCGCKPSLRQPFIQTKTFLFFITAFAVVTSAFPLYGGIFFQNAGKQSVNLEQNQIQKVEVSIEGMTCASCEHHIKAEIDKLPGIVEATASFADAQATVLFDPTRITVVEIEKAIDASGYSVIHSKSLQK